MGAVLACASEPSNVAAVAAAPANPTTSGDSVAQPRLIVSGPEAYWQAGTFTAVDETPEQLIDEAIVLQGWLGFGGTFNEKGWDALSLLAPAEREHALELLFDAERGARFTYGRIPIGASDYAMDRYTLSEQADDFAMTEFSIDRDRHRLIPFVKAALAEAPELRLWASPWTPPAWMKVNGSTDGGRIRDDPAVLEAYALYLARFIESYAEEGIVVGAIQPQNEPGYEQTYPTCLWTPQLLRDFVRDHLGPVLAERGLGTEIWFGTLSHPRDIEHVAAVMADPSAARYIHGIGVQWNTLAAVPEFAATYGLPIMQTEHRCGNYPWQPKSFNPSRAPNDHAYAEESWRLISSWIRAGVSAYLAWNMVLDSVGLNLDVGRPWPQNALLTVDRATSALTITPAYHVFRHLSAFVDPGAHRLATLGDADALAFSNPDGSRIAVLYNPTDAARNTTLGVGRSTYRFSIPAHGWATFEAPGDRGLSTAR